MLEAEGGESLEKPEPQELAASFKKLLQAWQELYEGHVCEREFLEFSSAIPFSEWECTVKALDVELGSIVRNATTATTAGEATRNHSSMIDISQHGCCGEH